MLWLTVFGVTLQPPFRVILTGDYSYLQFLTPGILAQSVIFAAIFYGINVVWGNATSDLLIKLLFHPGAALFHRAREIAGGGVRGTFQELGILLIVLIIGHRYHSHPAEHNRYVCHH